MRIKLLVPLVVSVLALNAHTAEFEYLGNYSNVKQSSDSQDCGGYDIELWIVRENSKGPNITGLFRLVDGNCDQAPRPVFNGRLNRTTGELTFEVPLTETPVPSAGAFKGSLKGGSLIGTLTLTNGDPAQANTQEMSVNLKGKQGR